MADEAVVRILLQESGGGSTQPSAPGAPAPMPAVAIPPNVAAVMERFSAAMDAAPALAAALEGLPGALVPEIPPATLAVMEEFIAAMEGYPDVLAAIESRSTSPAAAAAIQPPESPPPATTQPTTTRTAAAPAADQGAILADARSALLALGEKTDAADRIIAKLTASGEQFAAVQDAIVAAYRKTDPAATAAPPSSLPPPAPPPTGGTTGAASGADRYLEIEAKAALAVVRRQEAAIEAREKRQQQLLELEAHLALDLAGHQQAAIAARDKRDRELLELEARVTLEAAQRQQTAAVAHEERQQQLLELEAHVALDVARRQQETIDAREKRDRELLELEAKVAYDAVRQQQAAAEDAKKAEIAREDRERELLEIEARAALGVVRKQQEAAIIDAEPVPEPAEKKSTLDSLLDLASDLRGSIGGAVGGGVGSGLDLVAAMRKHQAATKVTPATVEPTRPGDDKLPTAEMAGGDAAAEAVPMVAVVMAVKKAVEMMNAAVIGGIRAVVGGASGVANFAADAIADPSVPIGKLGDAASQAGEQIAKVSPALGWMAVAAGESAKALNSFMQALDKTIERYGEYSPGIAQAQATAEIRQTMGDFRRSQEVSAEMARYLVAQSDLQQKFEDIKVKLLLKIVPVVTRVLEILEAVVPSGEGIEKAISALTDPLETLSKLAGEMVGMQRDDRIPDVEDPTTQLNNLMFRTVEAGGADRDPGWVPRR